MLLPPNLLSRPHLIKSERAKSKFMKLLTSLTYVTPINRKWFGILPHSDAMVLPQSTGPIDADTYLSSESITEL